jgi:hypothetical protein
MKVNQPEDRSMCEELLSLPYWKSNNNKSLNDLLILVGEYFIGAPYTANTIEIRNEEVLIVNLRQFDCFTFLENVIVLACLIEAGKTAFSDYTNQLKNIRYRKGRLKGYASRLHYFSDWLYENQEKGIVKDITSEIGGKPYAKDIHFMTRHPEDYPLLKDKKLYKELLVVEKRISGRTRYIIPKNEFWKAEPKIENGSLIGITTDIEGLDVTHVGFAVWVKKHIHLLHASMEEKKVVVSKKTLGVYLNGKETMSGVVIGQVQSMADALQEKCISE